MTDKKEAGKKNRRKAGSTRAGRRLIKAAGEAFAFAQGRHQKGVVVHETSDGTQVTRGSGNVFADLGLPNPEIHLLKAQLVHQISRVMRQMNMNRADAAEALKFSQSDMSALVRGRVRRFSLNRLVMALHALGYKPEFVVRKL